MIRKKANAIEWLESSLFLNHPEIKHAFFLKHGGYSNEKYSSLNTGLYVGDEEEVVKKNLNLIEGEIKKRVLDHKKTIFGKATHGINIASVGLHSLETIENCDGLMTNEPGITLMMKNADCQIALFYDPQNKVIANIHSGWRGSAVNIYGKAIKKMKEEYGSHPSNIHVCISPSLGPNHAEFRHYRIELPESFWPFQVKENYFDFWAITESQLIEAEIRPHNIEIARICTYANAQDFFSHRRDEVSGRHATYISLSS